MSTKSDLYWGSGKSRVYMDMITGQLIMELSRDEVWLRLMVGGVVSVGFLGDLKPFGGAVLDADDISKMYTSEFNVTIYIKPGTQSADIITEKFKP